MPYPAPGQSLLTQLQAEAFMRAMANEPSREDLEFSLAAIFERIVSIEHRIDAMAPRQVRVKMSIEVDATDWVRVRETLHKLGVAKWLQ